jgi:hypothetical protein
VDVERLQPSQVVGLGFDRNDRVLPHPICPPFRSRLPGRFRRQLRPAA